MAQASITENLKECMQSPALINTTRGQSLTLVTSDMDDISDSDDDDRSEVGSFVLDQSELDDDIPDGPKFLLSRGLSDSPDDLDVNSRTQAHLEAFLEAAGIGKLLTVDGKHIADQEVFRKLTSSFSSALDEAAAALSKMAPENIARLGAESGRSLVEACSEGDVATVRRMLLHEGRNVNETTEEGESLLSLACSAGYFELAQVLLAMNASVEDRGKKGECTPIMEAASSGYVDIVNLLIDHGADVNSMSSSGNTALMFACANGHVEVVRQLLKARAHTENHNENGHTPLMEAASAGHVEVARILLEYGAGINTHSNEFKESALTLACYKGKGHLDMVRFLLESGADQEHKTEEMHTALMEAAMDGHVEVAQLLLDSGAQVNMPSESFESPLTLAACGGHVDVAALLLERGATIEEVNDEGYTPLMEAAREGHEEMCALLLANGSNINWQTEETQETALTLAACGGYLDVTMFLVKAGADIELGASTALMEASQEGHTEVVQYLVDVGASPHAVSQTQDTALSYAAENGHTDVVEILLDAGSELEHESEGGRTPVMKAARAGHLATVEFLISRGANIWRPTANNDHNALSLACAGGHTNVVELLLAHGVDPSQKLKDNSTMLIEASKGGHTAVVQMLLNYPRNMLNPEMVELPQDEAPRVPPHGEPALPVDEHSFHYPVSTGQNAVPIQSPAASPPSSKSAMKPVRSTRATPRSSTCEGEPPPPPACSETQRNLSFPSPSNMSYVLPVDSTSPSLNYTLQDGSAPFPKSTYVPPLDANIIRQLGMDPTSNQTSLLLNHLRLQTPGTLPSFGMNPNLLGAPPSSFTGLVAKTVNPSCSTQNSLKPADFSSQTLLKTADMTGQSVLKPAEFSGQSLLKNADFSGQNLLRSADFSNQTLLKSSDFSTQSLLKGVDFSGPSLLKVTESSSPSLVKGAAECSGPSLVKAAESSGQTLMKTTTTQTTLSGSEVVGPIPPSERPKAKAVSKKDAKLAKQLKERQQRLLMNETGLDHNLPVSSTSKLIQELTALQQARASLNHPQVQPTSGQLQVQATSGQGQPISCQVQGASGILQVQSTSSQVQPNAGLVQVQANSCQVQVQANNSCQVQPTSGILQVQANSQTPGLAQVQVSSAGQTQVVSPPVQVPSNSFTDQHALVYSQLQQSCLRKTSLPTPTLSQTTPTRQQSKHLKVPDVLTHADKPLKVKQRGKKKFAQSAASKQQCTDPHSPGFDSTQAVNEDTSQTGPVYRGVEVDSFTESNHDTALTLACAGGHEELVTLLISHGANIEHRDKKGFTPLILASTAGHANVVKLLLEKGANHEAQSERTKDTPLSLACSGGRLEVVALLLEKSANMEHRNVSDYTPLSLAASGGYVNVIELLLKKGAEINSRTNSKLGISPLMLASMNGHVGAVKLLLEKGSDINAQIETNKNTALTLACFQGRHEVVGLLLEKRANVEHRAKTGYTPLMEAASGGYVEVGRVLIEKGADVNATPVPASRDTALTVAAEKGHARFIELLIANDAMIDVRNKKGSTSLHLACGAGHLEVAQVLVNADADINAQDNRKVSCLMAAFRRGQIKIVKWLIRIMAQLPADAEMTRFISTVTDKELLKKCQQCMEIIRAASQRQFQEANKCFSSLMKELEMEKCREESRKAGAARKREKKRQKKKEKAEQKKLDDENKKDEEEEEEEEDQEEEEEEESDEEPVPEEPVRNVRSSKQPTTNNKSKQILQNPPTKNKVVVNPPKPSSDPPASQRHRKEKVGNKENRESKEKELAPPRKESNASTGGSNKRKKEALSSGPENTKNSNDKNKTEDATKNKVSKGTSRRVETSSSDAAMLDSFDLSEPTPNHVLVPNTKTSPAVLDFGASRSPKRSGRRGEDGWKEVVRRRDASATQSDTDKQQKQAERTASTRAKKVTVASTVISRVIGRGGCNVNAIREASGAHIEIEKQQKGQGERFIMIRGTPESTKLASQLITALVNDPDKDLKSLIESFKSTKSAGVKSSTVSSSSQVPAQTKSESSKPLSDTPSSTPHKRKHPSPSSASYTTAVTGQNNNDVSKASFAAKVSESKDSSSFPVISAFIPPPKVSVKPKDVKPLVSNQSAGVAAATSAVKTSVNQSAGVTVTVKTLGSSQSAGSPAGLSRSHPGTPVNGLSETTEFSPFNNQFSKMAQSQVWGKDGGGGMNFASAAAVGIKQSQVQPPGENLAAVDASKAPGYRGNLNVLTGYGSPPNPASPNVFKGISSPNGDLSTASQVENGRNLDSTRYVGHQNSESSRILGPSSSHTAENSRILNQQILTMQNQESPRFVSSNNNDCSRFMNQPIPGQNSDNPRIVGQPIIPGQTSDNSSRFASPPQSSDNSRIVNQGLMSQSSDNSRIVNQGLMSQSSDNSRIVSQGLMSQSSDNSRIVSQGLMSQSSDNSRMIGQSVLSSKSSDTPRNVGVAMISGQNSDNSRIVGQAMFSNQNSGIVCQPLSAMNTSYNNQQLSPPYAGQHPPHLAAAANRNVGNFNSSTSNHMAVFSQANSSSGAVLGNHVPIPQSIHSHMGSMQNSPNAIQSNLNPNASEFNSRSSRQDFQQASRFSTELQQPNSSLVEAAARQMNSAFNQQRSHYLMSAALQNNAAALNMAHRLALREDLYTDSPPHHDEGHMPRPIGMEQSRILPRPMRMDDGHLPRPIGMERSAHQQRKTPVYSHMNNDLINPAAVANFLSGDVNPDLLGGSGDNVQVQDAMAVMQQIMFHDMSRMNGVGPDSAMFQTPQTMPYVSNGPQPMLLQQMLGLEGHMTPNHVNSGAAAASRDGWAKMEGVQNNDPNKMMYHWSQLPR